MESSDLNPPPSDDTALDSWLRSQSSLPPLPDAGFSRGVLAALPARRRKFNRLAFCLGGLAAGVVVAALGFLESGSAFSLATLDALLTGGVDQLLAPPTLAALAAAAVSAGYALGLGRARRFLPRF